MGEPTLLIAAALFLIAGALGRNPVFVFLALVIFFCVATLPIP